MTLAILRSAVATRIRRFSGDQRAVSAVEFSILLPLMITLYLGGVEVSQAVSADRKNMMVAHTIGDLVSQVSTVSNADMTNILNAGSAVAYPFPASNLTITVSSVTIDATGKATVAWSDTLNGTKRTGVVTSLIPAALRTPNTSVIWAEAYYVYRPTIGWVITGSLTLSDKVYLRPRLSSSVARTA